MTTDGEQGREREKGGLTDFLKPRKAPKKVRGREMPSQRHSRASSVVNGIAALEPAPHRNRFSVKNIEKTTLHMERSNHHT